MNTDNTTQEATEQEFAEMLYDCYLRGIAADLTSDQVVLLCAIHDKTVYTTYNQQQVAQSKASMLKVLQELKDKELIKDFDGTNITKCKLGRLVIEKWFELK